jgi:hypothetical protein
VSLSDHYRTLLERSLSLSPFLELVRPSRTTIELSLFRTISSLCPLWITGAFRSNHPSNFLLSERFLSCVHSLDHLCVSRTTVELRLIRTIFSFVFFLVKTPIWFGFSFIRGSKNKNHSYSRNASLFTRESTNTSPNKPVKLQRKVVSFWRRLLQCIT